MNDDTLDSASMNTSERPQFLTVLCILTFVGSGMGLLGSLFGLIGNSALSAFMPEGSVIWMIVGFIYSGLCLFGAIQMWGLKKQGFSRYLIGSVTAIIASLYQAFTFKNSISDMTSQFQEIEGVDYSAVANASVWASTIISVIIIIAFVGMYNANKKALIK